MISLKMLLVYDFTHLNHRLCLKTKFFSDFQHYPAPEGITTTARKLNLWRGVCERFCG
jgi:hypothetical protein